MALLPGSLRLPWRRSGSDDDPYWDAFINRAPADVRNTIPEIIGKAPEGNVFPTLAELHTPQVTSDHVKELALYLNAQLVGIADLSGPGAEVSGGFPFAVVCAVQARYDPYTSPGIGGQAAVQAGQFVTFIVAAWIRELGYRATMKIDVQREQRERLAVAAGLGTLNGDERLVVAKHGTRIHVADIVFTDLPLVADGQEKRR
jgi:hypothetical protein